jgi:hypothetical protein
MPQKHRMDALETGMEAPFLSHFRLTLPIHITLLETHHAPIFAATAMPSPFNPVLLHGRAGIFRR